VVLANAWMNAPTGFQLVDGRVVNVDPIAAMASPAAFPQALHMTLAAYAATGFAVAGIHAFFLLKDPANAFHRRALEIALIVGAPAAVLQPVSGDLSARHLARDQPVKLAAAEALFTTQRGAPLTIGGWPDPAAGRRARDADGVRRRGGGMDGDRAGSAAVGDLRCLADARCGHADARPGRPVRDVHAAVLLPRRDRVLAPVSADPAQPRDPGVAG